MTYYPRLIRFVLCFLSFATTTSNGHNSSSYGSYMLVRIDSQLDEDVVRFLSSRVDFWTTPAVNSSVDFMVSPTQYRVVRNYLKEHKLYHQVLIDDVQREIDNQLEKVDTRMKPDRVSNRVDNFNWKRKKGGYVPFSSWSNVIRRAFPSLHANSHFNRPVQNARKFRGHSMNWIRYQRLDVIYQYMYYLEDRYPDLASVIDIGATVEKKRMLLLKIGSNAYANKPAIFIEAGIHAREWIAPATATYIMRELVENHRRNEDLTDYYDFYILPVANPDGYEFSFVVDRLWRKNRASFGGLAGLLLHPCNGVDLNRNFGYHWSDVSTLNFQGGTQLNCLETYSGPAPFSEPESRNIAAFVKSIQPSIVSYLAIHNYGQKVMYPWSYTEQKIPDWRELHYMGEIVANEIEAATKGLNYVVGSSPHIQYLASGGSDDWARGSMGIKWVFLLELPDKGLRGFLLPPEEIRPTGFSIFRGIRALAVEISQTLSS